MARCLANRRSEPLPLLMLLVLSLPSLISGIRREAVPVGMKCRNTVPGRFLLADDAGYVCNSLSIDPQSRCCPKTGKQFSCHGCNLVSECCDSYEFCVSCCLNPIKTVEEIALKVKIAKPVTAGTYDSVFDFCVGRCRHNSASVVHENAYASDFHHCFSLQSNSSGFTEFVYETRLTGINIVIGRYLLFIIWSPCYLINTLLWCILCHPRLVLRQGESCSTACNSKGQSCVPNKLPVLNKCEFLQKHMNCKGKCLPSLGADQPAEVTEDAPHDLNPGACLFTQSESALSCDGSHPFTKRLCPCA